MPIRHPGRDVWHDVARELVDRCLPLHAARI
jgi:hypothetical protein